MGSSRKFLSFGILKRSKRKVVRYGLLSVNLSVLAAVSLLVTKVPQSNVAKRAQAANSVVAMNPLDSLSSADIASQVATIADLPQVYDVRNNADSVSIQQSAVPADTAVVSKPQVVATKLKSVQDVQKYITVEGDTVSSIASTLGVSSDSIRWSNNLTGEEIGPNQELLLPPPGSNGIVYTVKAGDTIDGLAERFKTNKELFVTSNDLDVKGLNPGTRVFLPEGVVTPAPARLRTVSVSNGSIGGAGFAFGNSAIYGRNGYAYGWCTWGVANLISIPANWGNASTWARGARASGWTVSATPRPGSIAQRSYGYGGLGHVALVTEVSEDGTMIKYTDMNGIAGWGRYGTTPNFVPASSFPSYIFR